MNRPLTQIIRLTIFLLLVGTIMLYGAGSAAWATPLHSPLGQTVPSPTPTQSSPDQPDDGDDDDGDDDDAPPITPTTIFLIATPTITPTMTMTPTVILPTVPAVPTVTPTIPVPSELPVTGQSGPTALLPPFWLIAALLIAGLALIWSARRKPAE